MIVSTKPLMDTIADVDSKHPPNTAAGSYLRCGRDWDHLLPPAPGQQLGQSGCGVIRNPREHVGQPGARIDAVQFAGLCRTPDYADPGCADLGWHDF